MTGQKHNFKLWIKIGQPPMFEILKLCLLIVSCVYLFLKICFINYTIKVVPFFLLFIPLHPAPTLPPSFPNLSSCPWVIHTSSLASTVPILVVTSPGLFCTYHLCFLFFVPFPALSPLPIPTDNLLCDLHFCDSVPALVVCLICFCFFRFSC